MEWNGRTLSPDTKILGGAPHGQRHWDMGHGDRISAWETVPVNASLDGNLTPACGEIWFLHSGKAGKDGWPLVVDARSGHIRKMTRRELRRPASAWGKTGIRRWRDHAGNHVLTLEEGLAWAVKHHRLIAMEPKGPAWGTNDAWFAMLKRICVKTGHPAWVKRLATLRFPKSTVIRAHRAKVQIAAIYGKGVRGRARRLAHTARIQRGWGRVHFDATW